jgi:hypothetical protein
LIERKRRGMEKGRRTISYTSPPESLSFSLSGGPAVSIQLTGETPFLSSFLARLFLMSGPRQPMPPRILPGGPPRTRTQMPGGTDARDRRRSRQWAGKSLDTTRYQPYTSASCIVQPPAACVPVLFQPQFPPRLYLAESNWNLGFPPTWDLRKTNRATRLLSVLVPFFLDQPSGVLLLRTRAKIPLLTGICHRVTELDWFWSFNRDETDGHNNPNGLIPLGRNLQVTQRSVPPTSFPIVDE